MDALRHGLELRDQHPENKYAVFSGWANDPGKGVEIHIEPNHREESLRDKLDTAQERGMGLSSLRSNC